MTVALGAMLFGLGAALVLALGHHLIATPLVLVIGAAWAIVGLAVATRTPQVIPPPASSAAVEALQAQHRVLTSLLDQTPAPLLSVHLDGAVRAVNRAARTLFEVEDRLTTVAPALLDALSASEGQGRVTVDLGAPGQARSYALARTELTGPGGVQRLAVLLDIQPELHAAEAKALHELMQVLSHEIMNALTPIASLAGTAEGLLDDGSPADLAQARIAVATLARRTDGLSRFVGAYRTLAGLPAPDPRSVSLTALLGEAARLFEARWRDQAVRLEVSTPSPDIIFAVDEELALHALSNLLSNAAEAAIAMLDPPPWVRLEGHARQGGVSIRVSDSGPGLDPADGERPFQPFFTTKPTGIGVGLSVARQIARSHGGDVVLERGGDREARGHGANFVLTL